MTKRDNSEELLPQVDPEGRVLGSITRGQAHGPERPLHPVVHLHLFNSKGELYLQHRPAWKDVQPDKWDTAVGGHIDWGEDVQTALFREVREEIGLDMKALGLSPMPLASYVFECPRERELVNVFKLVTDIAPVPSDELDGGRFFSREEINERLDTAFFTPNFEQEWKRLVNSKNTDLSAIRM